MPPLWKEQLDQLRLRHLSELFGVDRPVIGMVHCWPMPGAPGYTGYGVEPIIEHAVADARALAEGGCHGLIVENMWDIPFCAGGDLAPESVAVHAVVARAVADAVDLPLGINLVHNGGVALLAVAIAAGASFVRVCMFTGAGVWDGGQWDEGCAAELLRRRAELQATHIKLLADVDKKHSVRFPGIDLQTHIEWTNFFGADALIVSGRMTGDAPDLDKVRQAKAMAGDCPVLLGSGTDEHNIGAFLQVADGVIVGSSIKQQGLVENPVDPRRVRRFVQAAAGRRQDH